MSAQHAAGGSAPSSSDVPALIWTFGLNDAPAFVLIAPHSCASLFAPSASAAPSLRASWNDTPTLPLDWSTASFGRNWLFAPASSLTWVAALQLAPSSSEKRNVMSVSLFSSVASSVYTA